jgi:hypothetical protein
MHTITSNGVREVRAIVDIQWDVNGGEDECPASINKQDVWSDSDLDSEYESESEDDSSDDDCVLDSDFSNEFDDDDGYDGAFGAPGQPKKSDTVDQQDQDKCVLTLAYNARALKFKAQKRLAVILRGKNAKVPRPT